MSTCIYCGRPLTYQVKVSQLLTGGLWRIDQDLVPFVCCEWCGQRWEVERHPMRSRPYEVAR